MTSFSHGDTGAQDQRRCRRHSRPLACYDLGLVPYEPVQELQAAIRDRVSQTAYPGVLLLLEHQPVITLGMRASLSEVRATTVATAAGETSLPVVRSERGGLATLHAPGQLVAYPVMPIPGRDLRGYVRRLEETARRLLSGYGVWAERREGRPGLYTAQGKIASIGLRCARWVTSHGIAINIAPDLCLFEAIVSCGDPNLHQTSLAQLTGLLLPMSEVKRAYAQHFGDVFQMEVREPRPASVEEAWREVCGR